MQPPNCIVCGLSLDGIPQDASLHDHFTLVRFADYWRPDDPDWCGHPRGLDWFCNQHAKLATERTGMSSKDACDEIIAIVGRIRGDNQSGSSGS
jgi:hypothetical protein